MLSLCKRLVCVCVVFVSAPTFFARASLAPLARGLFCFRDWIERLKEATAADRGRMVAEVICPG